MAKFQVGISIDDDVAQEAKGIGIRNRWNFSEVVEIGLRLFIAQYGKVQLPGLAPIETPEETPELEQVTQ